MKNTYLFITLLFCFLNKTVAQDFQWVGQIKGIEDETETANFIEVDNNGNSYTVGKSSSIQYDIDPTQNGVQLINNQNSLISNPQDIYLTKLNANGDFVWGKSLSVLKDDESVLGLKLDSQGNIYVLAFITELYKNQSLVYGYGFINVIKIDPNGNELYRRKFQNLGNINAGKLIAIASFDIDSSDNIYVAGMFQNTVILDSNPQNNLVANGNSNYVFKLNQSGAILWSKNLNFLLSGNIHLKIDSNDKINLLFSSFDNLNNSHVVNILKLDNTNGNQIWIKSIGNAYINNFSLDANDNFVIIGIAANNNLVDLDPDPIQSKTIQDKSFILFLDANGNYFDSKLFDINITFNAVEIDNLNNYHLVGHYANNIGGYSTSNSVDFDPSSNDYLLSTTAFYSDGFYLKLDANRLFSKAFIIGSSPSTNGTCYNGRTNALKVVDENVFIAGDFAGNCDLDPSLISSHLLNSFNQNVINLDGFILKIGDCDDLAPVAPDSQTFCSAQNPKISDLSPSSTSINWYASATDLNQLDNSVTLVNGQTYYASKQVGSCPESQRLAVTVTINQSPANPIITDQTFCENENATISNLIVTGQNIKWYSSLTETDNLSINTVLQNNTNYYACQTVNGCESNRTIVNVTINSVSPPTMTSPQIFCIQQNATLNSIAITGQNIKWYDAAIGGNLLPSSTNLVNGETYFASQTDTNCESIRASVLINIQDTSAPTGTSIQTFCSTQNPTLNDIVVNGTNLNWYNTNSDISTIPNTTLLVNGTTYYVSQIINNCESINRLAITVNLITNLNANDYSETICDNLNDGLEVIDLSNYNINLISNPSNFTFEYYSSLSGATNQTITNLISTVSNYNLTTRNYTIFVRITSTNGCYQIVKLNTLLLSSPIIPINDVVSICENKNIIINAGLGFDSYMWSTGSTSQSITVSQAGNYSVTVTKNYGTTICSSTKNFTVVLSNAATITNIETRDWTDNENIITVNTSSNSYGNYEFSIDGINYQDSNVFSGLISGVYTVYARDKNGCGVTEDEIFLLMYPKFFTPNSDGYNDTWAIKFSYTEPKLNVNIFDRYGKLLKTLNNVNSWDGKYNGHELPSSDYWFVVTRENGKEYRGHFTLKR
ncbi:T9SS type B sorting domain-containing protein [Flavobacterium sp. DGU38]|uniref:T9SS type B sorting domain-containing protein n=1 Tax=Flavobacterium calami TaxID=3139144 RepID=A0ABU9IMX0_9FLAO